MWNVDPSLVHTPKEPKESKIAEALRTESPSRAILHQRKMSGASVAFVCFTYRDLYFYFI